MVRVACVTMAYNEKTNLPRWLRHYGKWFGVDSLYVIDDGSDDGSTKGLQCSVLRTPRLAFDDQRKSDILSGLQHSLLKYYDVVIVGDTDEYIVADPARFPSLNDYCDQMTQPIATPIGLNIVHLSDREAPLDQQQPILGQRQYVFFAGAMCKSVVTKVPTTWGTGNHRSAPGPQFDPDLYLFHTKHADFEQLRARQAVTRDMEWAPEMLRKKMGNHQRQSDQWLEKQQDKIRRQIPGAGFEPFDFTRLMSEAWAGRNEFNGLTTVDTKVRGPLMVIPSRFYGAV